MINVKISPAASQEIWHHTVWRTWLFIAYSDEKWLYYKFSLHHSYNRFLKGRENTLFELRSERVKQGYPWRPSASLLPLNHMFAYIFVCPCWDTWNPNLSALLCRIGPVLNRVNNYGTLHKVANFTGFHWVGRTPQPKSQLSTKSYMKPKTEWTIRLCWSCYEISLVGHRQWEIYGTTIECKIWNLRIFRLSFT